MTLYYCGSIQAIMLQTIKISSERGLFLFRYLIYGALLPTASIGFLLFANTFFDCILELVNSDGR